MRKVVIILFLLITYLCLFGQNCVYTNLSESYDFKIKLKRGKRIGKPICSNVITLIVFKKNQKRIQTISFNSSFLFHDAFRKCNMVRSYSTGVNMENTVDDYDYGDFIVSDFNFDGIEDFAVKNNSGGNSGPTYNFYFQNSKGRFVLNNYLTCKMEFFPVKINSFEKTLTTLVYVSSSEKSEMTYRFDSLSQKWSRIKHELKPNENE